MTPTLPRLLALAVGALALALTLPASAEPSAPQSWGADAPNPLADSTPVASPGYTLQTLVPPSLFHGIHGLKVGPDGALYAADIYGLTIWRIDLATGVAAPFVPFPNGMADDLAFAPDGALAWTSPFLGTVTGRRPDGTIYEIAHGLPAVNGIGFTRSGRLIVSQISPDSGPRTLVELDPAGQQPPKVILDHTGGINGFRIDKDDVLWGPQGWAAIGLGNVVRVDLKTMKMKTIAGGFTTPTGVDLDAAGNLYVVDLMKGTVSRVDPATGAKTLLRQLTPWLDNLTMGPGDRIYVSGTADNAVWQVDAKTGDARAARLGGLALPGGLAMDPAGTGDVYVADTFSYKRVDGKTGQITDYGHRAGYAMAAGMSMRAAGGKLLLSDAFYGGVRVIDPATHAVVRTVEGLDTPQDATMLPGGDIVVAELGAKRLSRIAPGGAKTTLADGFAGPVGLVLGEAGTLYVTDALAGAVVRVDFGTGAKTVVAQGLRQPEGIDRGPDGALIVVEGDGGGTVLRIDPATGATTTLARGLPVGIVPPPALWPALEASPLKIFRPPVWVPNGVAVGADGAIYVSADKVGALYKLTAAGP